MRIKIILYYLLEFILSIMILLLFLIFFFKSTILNPNYIIKELKKNDYYSTLCENINSDMSNYIIQSGLEETVLKDIYTEEMVTKEVNSIITSFYKGKEIKVNLTEVKKNLEANIISYLEKNNIEVTDQIALDRFVDQILKVYKEKIILSDSITAIQKQVIKINKFLDIIFILLIFLSITLSLIIFLELKKESLAIPIFMSSIIMWLTNYLLFKRIDVKHILFWNDSISKLIKSIVYNLSFMIKISCLVLILLGLTCCLLASYHKKKN